jgi:hypothetical protein
VTIQGRLPLWVLSLGSGGSKLFLMSCGSDVSDGSRNRPLSEINPWEEKMRWPVWVQFGQ